VTLSMWAIWEPVDPAANPLVIAGDFGNAVFSLVEQVPATSQVTNQYRFQGSASSGKWKKTNAQAQVASVLARLITPVELDMGTSRLAQEQINDILWKASLLQMPPNKFAVVAVDGKVRLARVKKLNPLTVDCPTQGTWPARQDEVLSYEDLFVPGMDENNKPTQGVALISDLSQQDRDDMDVIAGERQRIRNPPQYTVRGLNRQQGQPVVLNPQQVGPQQPSPYSVLLDATPLGTQWTINVSIGGVLKLDRQLVEMKKHGYVSVLSGPQAGLELPWPAPPTTHDGSPIVVSVVAGPVRPGDASRIGGDGYDALDGADDFLAIDENNILFYGVYLDDPVDPVTALLQLKDFVEKRFYVSHADVMSPKALLRDQFLRWAKRAVASPAWKSDPDLRKEGADTLRALRLAHVQSLGYDVQRLVKGNPAKDDVLKEMQRQDGLRGRGRGRGGGKRLQCFACGGFGHVRAQCPQRSRQGVPSPGPKGPPGLASGEPGQPGETGQACQAYRPCQSAPPRALPSPASGAATSLVGREPPSTAVNVFALPVFFFLFSFGGLVAGDTSEHGIGSVWPEMWGSRKTTFPEVVRLPCSLSSKLNSEGGEKEREETIREESEEAEAIFETKVFSSKSSPSVRAFARRRARREGGWLEICSHTLAGIFSGLAADVKLWMIFRVNLSAEGPVVSAEGALVCFSGKTFPSPTQLARATVATGVTFATSSSRNWLPKASEKSPSDSTRLDRFRLRPLCSSTVFAMNGGPTSFQSSGRVSMRGPGESRATLRHRLTIRRRTAQ